MNSKNVLHDDFKRRLKEFIKTTRISNQDLGKIAGISKQSISGYMKKSLPTAPVLAAWSSKLGLDINWLLTGSGTMLCSEKTVSPVPRAMELPVIPLIGLAACGIMDMEQIMPYTVIVSPIRLSGKSIAVVASGESMVPAGIAYGHVCYCDPELEAMPGEVVFLRQRGNLGALKIFLGRQPEKGTTVFKGWFAPDETGQRKDFIMEIKDEVIEEIAPVVLVRRRL